MKFNCVQHCLSATKAKSCSQPSTDRLVIYINQFSSWSKANLKAHLEMQ